LPPWVASPSGGERGHSRRSTDYVVERISREKKLKNSPEFFGQRKSPAKKILKDFIKKNQKKTGKFSGKEKIRQKISKKSRNSGKDSGKNPAGIFPVQNPARTPK
jgi:hypothetical protein